jgi:L-seryl-tRNA(Ser) seleniumtransferase
MRGNSLFRALRVDKLTYAALEATLLAYVKHDYDSLPALRMMRLTKQEIQERAGVLAGKIQSDEVSVEIIDGESVIGGGAAPTAVLPTWLVAVTVKKLSADELIVRLRTCDPPILARVDAGRVLLDLRTVFPEQGKYLEAALKNLVQ